MRLQTRFLAGAFRDYESRVRESGACDEHTLRERLMAEPAVDPVRQVIVTIADWIADAEGLYQADFDLLTRIPGLESLDIVCDGARPRVRLPRTPAQLVARAGGDGHRLAASAQSRSVRRREARAR